MITPEPPRLRVAVVSIGRSGTSLLSRILHEVLGVDFGEEKDHIPRNHNNPDGYFENRELLEMNEQILQAIGGSVLQPPALDFQASLPMTTRVELVSSARKKLSTYSHGKARFGWKDPRLSLTFPIWQMAEPALIPLVVFRDPAAVMRSIAAQLSTEPGKLGGLWSEYYRRIFAYTADTRRLVVSFHQLLQAPLAVTGEIAGHLGIPAEPGRWQPKLDHIVKPSEVHHASPAGAARPAFLDERTEALYAYLRETVEQCRQPVPERIAGFFPA